MNFISKNIKSKQLYCYFLVNKGVKLSSGKVASQVGHASQLLTEKLINSDIWDLYNKSSNAKIILKVPNHIIMEEILQKTGEFQKVLIFDKGLTQCPPNTLTVIGYAPMLKQQVPDCFKCLKLF